MTARVDTGQAGFTLVEVVVAMAIFAIVAALAWGGLDRLLRAREVIDERSARWSQLQLTLGQFERDVRQSIVRPVRDSAGQPLPALLGSAQRVELTRVLGEGGWQRAGASLQRVAWECVGDEVHRLWWPMLDRAPGSTPAREVMLTGVESCRFEYILPPQRSDSWPRREDPGVLDTLPRALDIELVVAGEGRYHRLLELPADRVSTP